MQKIRWAPKVQRELLVRLYRSEARLPPDPVLVEEVGGRLFERCQSVLWVSDGNGVRCPECATLLRPSGVRWSQDDHPRCGCGWTGTSDEWAHSWRHRELNGANAIAAFRAYEHAWPRSRTERDRVICIDQLIHAFHVTLRREAGRPAANNLMEGSVTQVVALLDSIGGTTFGLDEVASQHEGWQSTTSEMVRRRRQSGGETPRASGPTR